jgi:hypothetical protein
VDKGSFIAVVKQPGLDADNTPFYCRSSSIPPYVFKDFSQSFSEIVRIHFYVRKAGLDFWYRHHILPENG